MLFLSPPSTCRGGNLRGSSYLIQELGRRVGTVRPFDGGMRQPVLDKLIHVEQLAEDLAGQVRLQIDLLPAPVTKRHKKLVILDIIHIYDS